MKKIGIGRVGWESCDGFLTGEAIGDPAGEVWSYCDEGIVGLAPVDFIFVFCHRALSAIPGQLDLTLLIF